MLGKALDKGDALPEIRKLIDQRGIERYAEASGDFNPIHIDSAFAETTQFGGTIAHGMMVAATISEMMTEAFGSSWNSAGKMKIRFRAPVKSGERITARAVVRRVEDIGDSRRIVCAVSVVTDDGATAIAGTAEVIAPADSRKPSQQPQGESPL